MSEKNKKAMFFLRENEEKRRFSLCNHINLWYNIRKGRKKVDFDMPPVNYYLWCRSVKRREGGEI